LCRSVSTINALTTCVYGTENDKLLKSENRKTKRIYEQTLWIINKLYEPRTSPRLSSGLLTTADSATAGCSMRALSTSNGPIRYLIKNYYIIGNNKNM